MTTQEDLLTLVNTLLDPPGNVDDDELSALEERFIDAIPHPGGVDLLNYPEYWGLPKDASAEEIVECALSWVPKAFSMRITAVRAHPTDMRLRCYEVVIENKMRTQVVAEAGFGEGKSVVVALSGCILRDGTIIRHSFVGPAFSVGRLISGTDDPAGTDLTGLYCRNSDSH